MLGNLNRIRDEGGMEAFNDFVGLNESDIRDTASGLSKRTTDKRCINFGMRRVKYTLGIMHWAQDDSRCSCKASLTGIADAEEYKALLGTALDLSRLKKVGANQDATTSKAKDPGKLKDKSTWPEWEVNSKIIYLQPSGSTVCPCHTSCVIRQLLTSLQNFKKTS